MVQTMRERRLRGVSRHNCRPWITFLKMKDHHLDTKKKGKKKYKSVCVTRFTTMKTTMLIDRAPQGINVKAGPVHGTTVGSKESAIPSSAKTIRTAVCAQTVMGKKHVP